MSSVNGIGKNQADLSLLKGGLQKKDLNGNAKMESIFDAIDKDKNGILDDSEIKKFLEGEEGGTQGFDKDGNKVGTNKEANAFIKENNLKGEHIKKKDVIEFLKQYGQNENLENIESTVKGEDGKITITYKDGNKKIINPEDNSYQLIKPNGEKGSITENYNAETILQSKEVISEDGTITTKTIYREDGQTEKAVIETNSNDNTVSTTAFDKDGNKKSTLIENEKEDLYITIKYEDNKPASKTVEHGASNQNICIEDYTYDENGNEVIQSKVEHLGFANETNTKYTHNEDGSYTEDITCEGENTRTVNTCNSDGHKLTQTKTVDGEEYSATYDGQGNTTGVVLQNRESIEQLAKKFGCSVKDLQELNGKQKFAVGDTIKVPGEVEADNVALRGRKSSAEAIAEKKADDAARLAAKRRAAAEREAQYKELGLINHNGQGQKVTGKYKGGKTEEFTVIGQCKYERTLARAKNGTLVVIAKDGTLLKTDYVKNPEKYEEARRYNENVKTIKTANGIAAQIYKIADDNAGMSSIRQINTVLKTKVNSKNITAVLDAYDKHKHKDSSIIDTITSEVGASGSAEQKQALFTIMKHLSDAARAAGVSEADIQKANNDFAAAYKKEYASLGGAFRRTNPKDMEKAMDSLRGAIASKQMGATMSDADAIKEFKGIAVSEHNSAARDFRTARNEEGWAAKVGDTVCGWFGCNTIKDLEKKIGKNKEFVQALVNSKSEAEFKKIYQYGITTPDGKKIPGFGVPFDANKIAARQKAIENYQAACSYQNTSKYASQILNGNTDYLVRVNMMKKYFQYSDSDINAIIDNFAKEKGITNPTRDQKKEILNEFLTTVKNNANQNLRQISGGKSVEQMGKDIELITRSAFGTSDIVKDVIQFNENQQTTEFVTEAAFEIAGTIALQFVPGAGAMAAAKLAVSAAKWGSKATKVVSYATKISKGLKTVDKFAKGERFVAQGQKVTKGVTVVNSTRTAKVLNNTAKVGTQMVNAGVATEAVDLSNGRTVKEATRKALMNMSFAGVGASSSIIAPKLMETFGITNSALARELAEEIMNAAGSYGVTKLAGDDYGTNDAFIDMAAGLIMSRLSHVKGSKPTASTTPTNSPTLEKATSHQGANGTTTATPSGVHVGAKKAETIRAEIDAALPNITSGTDLAQMRHQANAISNRDLRRETLRKIDDASTKLPQTEQAAFASANRQAQANDVQHIFDKNSILNDADARTIREYIANTTDVQELEQLATNLKTKETTNGGITATYKELNTAIEKRKSQITPVKVDAKQMHDDVVKMLNTKAGKGINENDFKMITDYISTITEEAQIKELTGLLAGQKMTGAHKKALKEQLNQKVQDLHKPANLTNTSDVTNSNKTTNNDNSVAETNNNNNTNSDIKVSEKVDYSIIDKAIKTIKDADIPAELKQLWHNTKQQISDLAMKLSSPVIPNKEALLSKYNGIMKSLNSLIDSATGDLKQQFIKLKNYLENLAQSKELIPTSNRNAAIDRRIEMINNHAYMSDELKELKVKQLQREKVYNQFEDGISEAVNAKEIADNLHDYYDIGKAVIGLIDNPMSIDNLEILCKKFLGNKFDAKIDKLRKKLTGGQKLSKMEQINLQMQMKEISDAIKELGEEILDEAKIKLQSSLTEHGYHINEHGIIEKIEINDNHIAYADINEDLEIIDVHNYEIGDIVDRYDEYGNYIGKDEIVGLYENGEPIYKSDIDGHYIKEDDSFHFETDDSDNIIDVDNSYDNNYDNNYDDYHEQEQFWNNDPDDSNMDFDMDFGFGL